jgi:hypothetical protein
MLSVSVVDFIKKIGGIIYRTTYVLLKPIQPIQWIMGNSHGVKAARDKASLKEM